MSAARAVTRARGPEVATRVATIAAVMRAGAWKPGKSSRELAKSWGVSLTMVEHDAAEAWRRVCAEADDAGKARPTIAGTVAVALAQAAEERQYKAIAMLADTWSKVVGARAPERHEHAVVVAQYDAMPKAGKVARLRELAAAATAEADRLEADEHE